MPYLGNIPASEFRTIDYQDFTGVTGSPVKRGFTLTSPVSSANDLEVFVNNVRQEPSVAYTVAGTTLTMTGDVETTDDFYVVYQGKAVGSVVPTDGSVSTTKIADNAVTSAKIADDAVTSAKLDTNIEVSGILSQPNKEYFRVILTSDQTGGSDNGSTDVNFASKGTVVYDTLSNWDASTNSYQFGSSDGVYLVNFSIGVSGDSVTAESIIDAGGVVRFSDDNFSSFLGTPEFGNAMRAMNENDEAVGSIAVSASSIYKATAASVKVKLQGYANTDATDYTIRNNSNTMIGGSVSANATITFLEIVRIA